MTAWRLSISTTALSVTLGCGTTGSKPSSTCAATQSLVTVNSDAEKKSLVQLLDGSGAQGPSTGGLIEVRAFADRADPVLRKGKVQAKTHFCAAYLDLPDVTGVPLKVWTASHCLSPDLTETVKIHLYHPAKRRYETLRLTLRAVEKARRARERLAGQTDSLIVNEVLTAFSWSRPGRGVTACQQASRTYSAPGKNVACASIEDLQLFQVELFRDDPVWTNSGTLSPGQGDTEGAMGTSDSEALMSMVRPRLASDAKLREESRALRSDWGSTYQMYVEERARASLARTSSRARNFREESCGIVGEELNCQRATKVGQFVDELFDRAYSAGPQDWEAKTLERLDGALIVVESMWGSLQSTTSTMVPGNFLVHSNFSLASPATSGDAPFKVHDSLGYLRLDPGFGATGPEYRIQGRSLVIVQDVAKSRVIFEPGDSGTLFSLNHVPFAVLTTVNGVATSGGSVLRPLPETPDVASAQPAAPSGSTGSPAVGEPSPGGQDSAPRESLGTLENVNAGDSSFTVEGSPVVLVGDGRGGRRGSSDQMRACTVP